jgi:chromate transport protein ChrA
MVVPTATSLTRAYNPRMAYSKPILAGLCASAITYLCFLTWIHMKATSAARERGTTGLIAVAGGATYVLHSPAFWALAIIAFGVAFFLFREA